VFAAKPAAMITAGTIAIRRSMDCMGFKLLCKPHYGNSGWVCVKFPSRICQIKRHQVTSYPGISMHFL
jgi:hypothetical protein